MERLTPALASRYDLLSRLRALTRRLLLFEALAVLFLAAAAVSLSGEAVRAWLVLRFGRVLIRYAAQVWP